MLSQVATLIARLMTAAIVGLLTFALAAYALRPYTSIGDALSLTEPEWFFAALLGSSFTAVTTWRLAMGASIKRELTKLVKANTEGDALD